MLAGPLMTLWTWRTARSLLYASSKSPARHLPTPYQCSLLIGICLASLDRLRRYTSYRWFRQRRTASPTPPILTQAGLVLYLIVALAGAMLAADTLLHYTTSTVEIDDVKVSSTLGASGRGLSQECLQLNRLENYGLPCSLNNLEPREEFLREHNEVFFLHHNASQISEIRILPQNSSTKGDVAVLLPQTQGLSPYVDYRASTIGISTSCKAISKQCKFGAWGTNGMYSGFYCSPNFWGVLGKSANVSDDSDFQDPDVPPLAFKLDPNLQ
jgi:hypothetical protein